MVKYFLQSPSHFNCPSSIAMLAGYHGFLFWPHWPASQTRGTIYKKPLPSHACFQLNSNLAIDKMRHYKDLVQFLQTRWLYNACSSTFPAVSLPLQIGLSDFIQDVWTQADRATSTASRGKYCCLKRDAYVAVLAGGKTRKTMAVTRSENAK